MNPLIVLLNYLHECGCLLWAEYINLHIWEAIYYPSVTFEDDICVVRACDNPLSSSAILDLKSIMFKLRYREEISHAFWHDPYVEQVL